MISITSKIELAEDEIQLNFVRSSGPGGQNVNKVSTAVQLRFDVNNSASLSNSVKSRLRRMAGQSLTNDGILCIDARSHRTQLGNRRDAIERLRELIRKAAKKPKRRVATKPSAGARAKRLTHKRQRGELKARRKSSPED